MSKVKSSFVSLGLNPQIINSLKDLGYEQPSPIQEECIPHLLAGYDVLGTAHTGSGKTAAFVLPLLHTIKPKLLFPQVLVLAPTRELAIQVGEVCSFFSKYMVGINVVTLYGGQRYDVQFRALRQKPQIIVGTPGRLLDHLNRGTLDLSKLTGLVLDEADEMLRMGFIEDVEKILLKVPVKRQTALFSATLPEAIRRITCRFMNKPKEVYINAENVICSNIQQNYWMVCGVRKDEALTRFLEIEDFDAAIVFVRTKSATFAVSEMLENYGYNSSALNGDMNQMLRQQTLDRFKYGSLDILIATDIAARGLDVHRINLVINYDIPIDAESYVHRIGRTGRAGRIGRSLLFIENREHRLLKSIERSINFTIKEINLPPSELLSARRLAKFSAKVKHQLGSRDLDMYQALLSKLQLKEELGIEQLAAVLLKMAQDKRPLILPPDPKFKRRSCRDDGVWRSNNVTNKNHKYSSYRDRYFSEDMDLYRIDVGRNDGIKARHIVGVIVNRGDINSRHIGNIKLFSSHSTIELPQGISSEILLNFNRARILNKPMNMQFLGNIRSRRITRRDV